MRSEGSKHRREDTQVLIGSEDTLEKEVCEVGRATARRSINVSRKTFL